MKRGEVWRADLGPVQGREQAGQRPVLLVQANRFTSSLGTVVVVPFTTKSRHARLLTCTTVAQGEGGLTQDSVALCHQIRVLDKRRLRNRLGVVSAHVLADVEACVLRTLEM